MRHVVLLVQRELDWRDGKRVARLLKAAKLKVSSACVEDIDWRCGRGLDRHLITARAGGDWIRHGRNLLITGVAHELDPNFRNGPFPVGRHGRLKVAECERLITHVPQLASRACMAAPAWLRPISIPIIIQHQRPEETRCRT